MSKKSIAIVTGANGGLGKEFVKLLLKEEGISEIWAIARNKEKLNQLLNEFGDKIRTFSMDLSNRASFAEIEKELNANDAAVKYLVNNAGFAKFCSYDDIGIDESLNMIDLNNAAVVAARLPCIPYMKNITHIINIA